MRTSDYKCTVDGCNRRDRVTLGFCSMHYQRLKRNGDPLNVGTPRGEASRWLREHVAYQERACLEWPFHRQPKGYGKLTIGGRDVGAHREMCRLAHGDKPGAQFEVAHACDNPSCVNPKHLRWATRQENHDDKRIPVEERIEAAYRDVAWNWVAQEMS